MNHGEKCKSCGEPILMGVLTAHQFTQLEKSMTKYDREDLVLQCTNLHISGHVKCHHGQKLKLRTSSKTAPSRPNEKYYACYLPYGKAESCGKTHPGNSPWYSQKEVQEEFEIEAGKFKPKSSTSRTEGVGNNPRSSYRSNSTMSSKTTFDYLKNPKRDNGSVISSRLEMSDKSLPLSCGISNDKYHDYMRGEKTLNQCQGNAAPPSRVRPKSTPKKQIQYRPPPIKSPPKNKPVKPSANNNTRRGTEARSSEKKAGLDYIYREKDDQIRGTKDLVMELHRQQLENTNDRIRNIKLQD